MMRALSLPHIAAVFRLALLAAFLLLTPQLARAQTADIDWADAGVASLTPLPTGTVVVGSDGTTATVDWSVQIEGPEVFEPEFGGDFVSYFSGTVGGAASPLLVSFDNSTFDPRDKVTIVVTLSRPVSDLQFSLNDIDSGGWRDAVELFYSASASGPLINAATDNSLWTANSSVTRTNDATVNGWRGTSGSATGSTNGNVTFDFTGQTVQRIEVTYFSYTNPAGGNPVGQFATLSDLQFAEATADLSLTKQFVGSAPSSGGFATWRLTASNDSASQGTASGIVVEDTFPGSFTFDSASGDGSFNSGNGEWTVGTLAPGQSATIDIVGTVSASAGSTVTNSAEIIASSLLDPDSTVDNAATGEDDFASASFTVAADLPTVTPTLFCPAGQILFDWETVNWPRGSLSNSYQLGTLGTIAFNIVTNGNFVSRTSFGGAVPGLTTAVAGGLSPAELALAYNQNNDNPSQQAVTTITLPQVFNGVQFTIFDIDRSGTFQDRITAYGLLNGVRVNAVLTGNSANTVTGTSIIGTSGNNDANPNGNGTITFLDPIDTIVFEYGNGPDAPSNPTNQSIAVHDISLCLPNAAELTVTKVSTVISDPVNSGTNPKAIPGATIEYLITVSNIGDAPAEAVVITDDGPADAKLCRLTVGGGPIVFDAGASGLSYTFASLGSGGDSLAFSNNDGGGFGFTPTPDPDGCDPAVTDFRITPTGTLAAGETVTLRVRYIIE